MMTDNYEDIRFLPHPTSRVHPRMPAEKRAAQFAPFAALTGFEEIISEKGRIPEEDVLLSEDEKTVLNRTLMDLAGQLAISREGRIPVELIYFEPDVRKAGGTRITLTGVVRKVDATAQVLVLEDGLRVGFDYIRKLTVADFCCREGEER